MKINGLYYLFFPVLIFFIIIIADNSSEKKIKNIFKHSKYTCGTIISDWHQRNNQGIGTDYEYSVNKVRHMGIYSRQIDKKDKYLVVYDSVNPNNSKLLFNHPIPNNMIVPLSGWKFSEIPIPIDSSELKDYYEELGMN